MRRQIMELQHDEMYLVVVELHLRLLAVAFVVLDGATAAAGSDRATFELLLK